MPCSSLRRFWLILVHSQLNFFRSKKKECVQSILSPIPCTNCRIGVHSQGGRYFPKPFANIFRVQHLICLHMFLRKHLLETKMFRNVIWQSNQRSSLSTSSPRRSTSEATLRVVTSGTTILETSESTSPEPPYFFTDPLTSTAPLPSTGPLSTKS